MTDPITTICNMALAHIGDKARVVTLEPPDSEQARHCAMFYPEARDTMLEMGQWGFATRRLAGTALTSELTEWPFAYSYPADALKVFATTLPGQTEDYMPQLPPGRKLPANFRVELDSFENRVVYSKVESAILWYVKRVTDASLFSATFRMATSWELGGLLSGPLVKGEAGVKMGAYCRTVAREIAGRAIGVDGDEEQVDDLQHRHRPPWMSGR